MKWGQTHLFVGGDALNGCSQTAPDYWEWCLAKAPELAVPALYSQHRVIIDGDVFFAPKNRVVPR